MKPAGFDNKLTHSIELLRKGESMALRFNSKGYYLAFSVARIVKPYIILQKWRMLSLRHIMPLRH